MRIAVAASAVMCAVLLAACDASGSTVSGPGAVSEPSAGAFYFDGLPSAAVREVLANPVQQQNLQGVPGPALGSLAQATVRNLIFCREELRVYQGWIATGRPPSVTPGPVPTHPLEPGNTAIKQDYANLRAAVASGEPGTLQKELTGNGSCGQWVPAAPGDIDGPTIARVAERQHA